MTDLNKVMAGVSQAVRPIVKATTIMVIAVVEPGEFELLAQEFPNALANVDGGENELSVAQGTVILILRKPEPA